MRARVQLWVGLLALVGGISYPVSYAGERLLQLNFVATFLATALLLLFGLLVIHERLGRKSAMPSEVSEADIDALELSEAIKLAEAVLSDHSKFVVETRHSDDFPCATDLPELLRNFFAEVESLKAVRGDAELVRQSIVPSTLNPEFIRIGRDIESVEIHVRAGDETIYEIDSFDPSRPFGEHRSIYHWLLAVDQELYGD